MTRLEIPEYKQPLVCIIWFWSSNPVWVNIYNKNSKTNQVFKSEWFGFKISIHHLLAGGSLNTFISYFFVFQFLIFRLWMNFTGLMRRLNELIHWKYCEFSLLNVKMRKEIHPLIVQYVKYIVHKHTTKRATNTSKGLAFILI